jgi:hypothetical protein
VGWSPTKISRAESGRDSIPPEEVEKLLDFYGAADPLRGQLLALAEDATQRGWWEDYATVLAPEYMEYIGLEAEATLMATWQNDVVPGILQTAEYARQVSVGYQSVIPTPPSVIDQIVRVRMIRQERLTCDPVLNVAAVIDEAVLLRRMGDNALMRAQLEHLCTVADLPNLDLRILPLDREIPLFATSFTVLGFGSWTAGDRGSLGDVVNIESIKTEQYIEGETDTYLFRVFFQALARAALSPEDSRRLLRSAVEGIWT